MDLLCESNPTDYIMHPHILHCLKSNEKNYNDKKVYFTYLFFERYKQKGIHFCRF